MGQNKQCTMRTQATQAKQPLHDAHPAAKPAATIQPVVKHVVALPLTPQLDCSPQSEQGTKASSEEEARAVVANKWKSRSQRRAEKRKENEGISSAVEKGVREEGGLHLFKLELSYG